MPTQLAGAASGVILAVFAGFPAFCAGVRRFNRGWRAPVVLLRLHCFEMVEILGLVAFVAAMTFMESLVKMSVSSLSVCGDSSAKFNPGASWRRADFKASFCTSFVVSCVSFEEHFVKTGTYRSVKCVSL